MMVTAGIAGAETGPTGPDATASGGATAVSLSGKRDVLSGKTIRLDGQVTPGGSREVIVRVAGREFRDRTSDDGRFEVRLAAPGSGVYRATASVVEEPSVRSHGFRVNVYRPAAASYYGPGLYGGHLACGGTLSPGKLGVANKSLPCGSRVTLRYHGHTVTVPVIDRGPYSGNREYDLTAATKAKLGFPSTGTVLTTR